jgi:MFS family permease
MIFDSAILTITNGAWSGAGYAYWAESFPTRVRGTAIGAMSALGLILGAALDDLDQHDLAGRHLVRDCRRFWIWSVDRFAAAADRASTIA